MFVGALGTVDVIVSFEVVVTGLAVVEVDLLVVSVGVALVVVASVGEAPPLLVTTLKIAYTMSASS